MVLSERNILKLSQELNLYRVEKKSAVDDLQKRVEQFSSVKHDFNAKAEFLYQKITDNSKILIEQIEQLTGQLGTVKRNVNEKFVNALNETKLYHNELSRTQEINRELMTEKSKVRSIVSQSISRSNNEMHSTY